MSKFQSHFGLRLHVGDYSSIRFDDFRTDSVVDHRKVRSDSAHVPDRADVRPESTASRAQEPAAGISAAAGPPGDGGAPRSGSRAR